MSPNAHDHVVVVVIIVAVDVVQQIKQAQSIRNTGQVLIHMIL